MSNFFKCGKCFRWDWKLAVILYLNKHGAKEVFHVHKNKSNGVKFVPGFCCPSSESEHDIYTDLVIKFFIVVYCS